MNSTNQETKAFGSEVGDPQSVGQVGGIYMASERLEVAVSLLRKLEWSDGYFGCSCPFCGGVDPERKLFTKESRGHRPDCSLGSFLTLGSAFDAMNIDDWIATRDFHIFDALVRHCGERLHPDLVENISTEIKDRLNLMPLPASAVSKAADSTKEDV